MTQISKNKNDIIIKKMAFLSLICCFLLAQAGQNSELSTTEAKATITNLMQNISNAQHNIDLLYKSDFLVKTIQQDIANLNTQIATAKKQAGISSTDTQLSSLQDQLNQGAVNIWVNSIDRVTNANPHKTINKILNTIFVDDPIIQEKMKQLSTLNREITDRIGQKDWIDRIKKIGSIIETTASNEIKNVSQAITAYQAAQAQVVNARNNILQDQKLSALEIALAQKKLDLEIKIAQTPFIHKQLLRYNNELKKLNFIFDLMQYPTKATNITQESISNLEIPLNNTIF